MAFLFVLFPIVEIYLLIKIGSQMGIANTFFYLLAMIVFGVGLIRTQGTFLIRNLQLSLAKKESPADPVIHSLLIFAAGALFAFPGFISDVVGLFLLLPGTRHLAARLVKRKFENMIRQGAVKFTSGGFSAFSAGFRGGFGPGSGVNRGPGSMRDVSPLEIDSQSSGEVIDVTPTKKE